MGGDKDREEKKGLMAKTLYVSDLDGTLLGEDSRVSAESASLLNGAIARGALFTAATARTPATVSILLSGIQVALPIVVMTGAAMWNPASGLYSDVVTMHPGTADEVLRAIRAHSLPAFMFTMREGVIQTYHTGTLSPLEKEFIATRSLSPYKRFHVPADGESEMPSTLSDVLLFYAMQPSAMAAGAYSDIVKIDGCNPIYYHDQFGPDTGILEVFSADASKANAVRKLKAATGADKIVAFGDNLNDLPLLRMADVAIAVENAVDEVKAEADIIIGPNTSDAVARYIHDNL